MPKEFHQKKLLKNETIIVLLVFFLLKWIPNAITAIRRSKSEQVFKSETTSFTKLWAPEPANKPPKCKQTRFKLKQPRFKYSQGLNVNKQGLNVSKQCLNVNKQGLM